MNIAEISIKRRTTTLVLTLVAIVAGLKAYEGLGRLEDPEFTIKDALIITPYPGASAAEVELEVTNEIELAAQQLGQLKRVKSVSYRGLSIVTVTMKDKFDKTKLPQVWDELRRKVGDAQLNLPPGAGPSIVNDDFGDVYGIYVAISGDGYSYREIKDYADLLRRELLLVQDVKRISYWGDRGEAIYVEMNRQKMALLGITQDQIFAELKTRNLADDGGRVRFGDDYIAIDPTGAFQSADQIRQLLISDPGADQLIYLGDVATVRRDYVDPPQQILRTSAKRVYRGTRLLPDEEVDALDADATDVDSRPVAGQRAIGLAISTVEGGNVVTMGRALEIRTAELQHLAPLGMQIDVISYQSKAVTTAIQGFLVSLLEAIAIVILILFIFMGLRAGVLIGFVLFLTITATFIFMAMQGVMLERISLGALIIALGMLVDNAIVVTDGMKVRIEAGEEKIKVAREVVAQNQWPLLGATVVAITAFAAIGLSQDNTGEFCRSLFTVMLISLLVSWLTAVTVTPLLCTMMFKPKKRQAGAESDDAYSGIIFRIYRGCLEWCIRRRWLTVVVVIGMFLSAIYGFGFLKNSFFPDSSRPQFMLDVWLPEGAHIGTTEAVVGELETYLMGQDNVRRVAAHIGGGAPRFLLTYSPEKANTGYAQLLVSVYDSGKLDETRRAAKQWADEHLENAQVYTTRFRLGPGDGGTIQVRFSGPDSEQLRWLAETAMEIMADDGGAEAIRSDWRQRVKVVRPILAEAQARRNGITRVDVANRLEAAFAGRKVGVFREGTADSEDRLIPIISRPPNAERVDVEQLNDLTIYSPAADRQIPLQQILLGTELVHEDQIIWRRNRIRTITIHCNQVSGEASTLRDRIVEHLEALIPDLVASGALAPEYQLEWGGEFESSKDAQAALASSLPMFLVLMVLIVIILFNNLRQPLIIWLTVPLAVIGIAVGLLIFDLPFNFMAVLGALSLAGMLIKNAIVLMDQINVNLVAGMTPYDAVVDSGVSRMRPVMMAAATTVLGMAPLLPDVFFQAMAVAVMFGLSFATVLTLIFVPVLYTIFYRIPSPTKK